jgi:hypothetical protein
MYLLFVVQDEGTYARKFLTLKEAKSSFEEAINLSFLGPIAVALYDLDKDSYFNLGDYGFEGDPIESWHNEDW